MKNCLKLSACVLVTAAYLAGLWLFPESFVTFLLGVPICIGLAALFHELGHLLAYRLLKLEWKRLNISCFVLEPGSGLRFDPDRRFFSASCVCAYKPDVPYWRYRLALLSGGLTMLVISMGCFAAFFFAVGGFASFLLCFGILSAANGLFNLLLPFSADRVLLKKIKQEREHTA